MKNGERQVYPLQNGYGGILQTGLTKREYFAGLAMQGLLANTEYISHSRETLAHYSIKTADELLKQLEYETTK